MEIDKFTVEHIAHLARIKLEAQELKKISRQFQEIMGFIDKLKQVDIKNINPTSHILPIHNVLRDDKTDISLSSGEALKNAPQKEEGFFVVPKTIE